MKRPGIRFLNSIYAEDYPAPLAWPQSFWQWVIDFIYVEQTVTEKKVRSLKSTVYFHRVTYLLMAAGACVLIYAGAFWLYQENLTNIKTYEDFFLTYKMSYDYNRYIGKPVIVAAVSTVFHPNTNEGAAPVSVSGYATSVPVLMYHRIATDTDKYNVTPAAFKAQMFALKRAGFKTVSAEDYADFIDGTKKLPAKSILITFDDGTKDSFYPTESILKALGFRATEFVITRYSIDDPNGSHYYLSAIELKAMERTGNWDLEVHTKDGHSYYPINAKGTEGEFYPNKLWLPAQHRMETNAEYASRVYNDMRAAKQEIVNFTHKPANLFAFPFSDIGEKHTSNYSAAPAVLTSDVQKLFKVAMMEYYPGRALSQGYYNSKQIYTYRTQVTLNQWTNGQGLVQSLQNGEAKSLPFTDNLQTNHGWEAAWGTASVSHGILTVAGEKGSTGAGVILDGTSNWSNYSITAKATLVAGQSYGIIARMQGESYRIGCYFGNNYASITRNVGYTSSTINETTADMPGSGQTQSLGVTVNGNEIECLENGNVILSADDQSMPTTGSIGFSVWDPHKVSVLKLQDIKVTPVE